MIKVTFNFSEIGQKKALAAGLNAECVQSFIVAKEADAKIYEDLAMLADIDRNGKASVVVPIAAMAFDTIPTPQEVVKILQEHKAKELATQEADKKRQHEKTMAVLRERRTCKQTNQFYSPSCHYIPYEVERPDWPSWPHYSQEVVDSPEAKVWLMELYERNERSLEAAKALALEKELAEQKAQQEAKDAEHKRREELGLKENEDDYLIENGALTQVPAWEDHRSGKNWMAIISPDPNSPGGNARKFADKAHGKYYYIVPKDLKVGDCLEFGADSYSSRGKKTAHRVYAVVTRIMTDRLILRFTKKDDVYAEAKKLLT